MNTSSSSVKSKSNAERKAIRAERLQLLRRNKAFLVGAFILSFWLLIAVFGSMLAPYPYDAMDFMAVSKKPSGTYWFGTNKLGQDVFSRVLAGTQLIVWMSFLATALGTIVGGTLGLAAGYFKGWFDIVLMRLLEAISAIPVLIVALLAIAALDGQSSGITVGVIGFVFAPNIARTVRAAVLSEAELEYVAAARLRAERTPHILFKEILPNVLPPIIVEFTVRLGYAIFAIATLSFLGAGVEAGSPNWGSQISENWAYIFSNIWWPTLFPAVAIASLAVSVNLISDGLLEVFEV
ncbi:peptide ABC transporter permease [Actinomycetes bacterium]|jgi:peptide/nickel transport system permease protein|nr:peptide ABC transporter permease [Actinomycetes bacterium]